MIKSYQKRFTVEHFKGFCNISKIDVNGSNMFTMTDCRVFKEVSYKLNKSRIL